jgi:hypothetical protein
MSDQGITPSYAMGQLAIGLELESQARIFEAFESTTLYSHNKLELAISLRTLLESLQISEKVADWYERLVKYEQECRPKYVAVEPGASPLDSERAAEPLSSDDEVPDRVPSAVRGTASLGLAGISSLDEGSLGQRE